MKDIEYIIGVYNFINASPEQNGDSAYYFLYLLDDSGHLDRTIAQKLYDESFKSELSKSESIQTAKMIGPFESTDLLNQYAFKLCEELNAEKVSLLSVPEYNAILENCQTAPDFHRDLLLKGNVMENIERKKKGGFFSRFF